MKSSRKKTMIHRPRRVYKNTWVFGGREVLKRNVLYKFFSWFKLL